MPHLGIRRACMTPRKRPTYVPQSANAFSAAARSLLIRRMVCRVNPVAAAMADVPVNWSSIPVTVSKVADCIHACRPDRASLGCCGSACVRDALMLCL